MLRKGGGSERVVCKRAYIVVFLVAEQTVDCFGVLTIGHGAELVVHSIFKFKN